MKNFVVGPGCFLPGQPKSFLLKIGRKLRGEYVAAWWTKMPISSFFFFFFLHPVALFTSFFFSFFVHLHIHNFFDKKICYFFI